MPERRRITRLRRLERVRAIAKRSAAAEAAQAEGVLSQLRRLSERTSSITRDYLARDDAANGYELSQTARFVTGLFNVAASTGAEADNAQALADRKLAQLAEAERRREAVAKRADVAERLLAKHAGQPALGARRQFGTELE
jgi:hypothetical protein